MDALAILHQVYFSSRVEMNRVDAVSSNWKKVIRVCS